MLNIDILGGLFRDFIFYGDNIHADEVLELPGGTGFNVYKGLTDLGINVIFHGSFGDDWPFEKIGRHKDGKSGIFVSHNEKEALSVYRGVNLLTEFEKPISNVLFASLECGGKIFEKYATYIKNRGGFVFLDPSPIFEWKSSFVGLVDLLLPNKSEFEAITRVNKSLKQPIIFEKMGNKGGRVIAENVFEIPPERIGNYPLSCGDVFDTIVIWGTLKGLHKNDILQYAVNTSGQAAMFKGSSSAVTRAVSNFIKKLKLL